MISKFQRVFVFLFAINITRQPQSNYEHIEKDFIYREHMFADKYSFRLTYSFGGIDEDDDTVTQSIRSCHLIRKVYVT